jgi:hypothetical protein
MSKFNTPAAGRTPIRGVATVATGTTHEGAAGFARDTKSELFLACVSNFVEDTFYERADQRTERIRHLIRQVAVDPEWVRGFVGWLRGPANLRSVGIIVAAECVHARLAAGEAGHNREIVSACIGRADEAGEFLGYWVNRFGRKIPSAVKRGINDTLAGLNEYAWLKWRGKGQRGNFSIADVINLTHPKPVGPEQEALFAAIIADAYGREFSTDRLPMLRSRGYFRTCTTEEKRRLIRDTGFAREAGLTHEFVGGALGKIDADAWAALLPTMGFQAVLMNLRRIHESGYDDAKNGYRIKSRLRDREAVAKSKMLPLRFLSAYRNAPLEYAGDLEVAANFVLANVPALPGRTLVLVDRSGSMYGPLSRKGTLTRIDAANVFGAALALRADAADLVAFGTNSKVVPFRKTDSLLRLADDQSPMGGTNTHDAVAHHYRSHDRIVLLTDEQATGWGWGAPRLNNVFAAIPDEVPTFTWNLAGYEVGHAPEGPNRHTFGGLTDLGMQMILPLEKGFQYGWPWEN